VGSRGKKVKIRLGGSYIRGVEEDPTGRKKTSRGLSGPKGAVQY